MYTRSVVVLNVTGDHFGHLDRWKSLTLNKPGYLAAEKSKMWQILPHFFIFVIDSTLKNNAKN